MSDYICTSRFRPLDGPTVKCGVGLRYHRIHASQDGKVLWKDQMEYIEPVIPRETSVETITYTNAAPPASERQVGGDHYKGGSMQPIDVVDAFGLDFYEGSALKYLLRHRKKNGKEDLQKAIHYIELLIERQYNNAESV